jgi:hypothetical protein
MKELNTIDARNSALLKGYLYSISLFPPALVACSKTFAETSTLNQAIILSVSTLDAFLLTKIGAKIAANAMRSKPNTPHALYARSLYEQYQRNRKTGNYNTDFIQLDENNKLVKPGLNYPKVFISDGYRNMKQTLRTPLGRIKACSLAAINTFGAIALADALDASQIKIISLGMVGLGFAVSGLREAININDPIKTIKPPLSRV